MVESLVHLCHEFPCGGECDDIPSLVGLATVFPGVSPFGCFQFGLDSQFSGTGQYTCQPRSDRYDECVRLRSGSALVHGMQEWFSPTSNHSC